MRRATAIAVVAVALGWARWRRRWRGSRPARERAAATAPAPAWTEVAWPFPIDQWGKGKAFRCKAADCGTEVNLYVRAKIGFCNCTTGVADDEELDRIGDFDLLGESFADSATAVRSAVAWMKGRSRAYALAADNPPGKSALSVGFNDRCDAIVATAVLGHERPAASSPA